MLLKGKAVLGDAASEVSTKCQRDSWITRNQCCQTGAKYLIRLLLHRHCGGTVRTHNPLVVGSIPTRPTSSSDDMPVSRRKHSLHFRIRWQVVPACDRLPVGYRAFLVTQSVCPVWVISRGPHATLAGLRRGRVVLDLAAINGSAEPGSHPWPTRLVARPCPTAKFRRHAWAGAHWPPAEARDESACRLRTSCRRA